ncbi:glycoside hydrolase family 26 protein [Dactylosporangium darangshiense]|uniref:GH26 domain-containing protein n=1 Tax=Dactylosporangium darangshiense TaxID=579108 RepID=A0ABP8DJJ5_9ACTN
MLTRRQLLLAGLATGVASMAGCSSGSKEAGNGRPVREFGIASDPWKAADWGQAVGAKPTMVMEFESWDRNRTLDAHFQAAKDGKMESFAITWEPWTPVDLAANADAQSAVQPKFSNQAIVAGSLDGYIRNFATAVKKSDLTVYIRYAHEMNGDWYPWYHDPAVYAQAWRHIVDVFRSVGAKKAKFVFAPAVNLYQADDSAWMAGVQQYWPGAEYVDQVGTTMINLGRSKAYYVKDFKPRLKLLHETFGKGVVLAEVNSASEGRLKFFTELRTWLSTPEADYIRSVILSQLPSHGQASLGDQVGDLSWQVPTDDETRPVIKALIKDITPVA